MAANDKRQLRDVETNEEPSEAERAHVVRSSLRRVQELLAARVAKELAARFQGKPCIGRAEVRHADD